MAKFHTISKLLIIAGILSAITSLATPVFMGIASPGSTFSSISASLLLAAVEGLFRLGVCLGMASIIEYLRKLTEQGQ